MTQRFWIIARPKRSALILVLVLFGLDALFIGAHALLLALRFFGFLESTGGVEYLKVSYEGGIPEHFNYLKLALVSIVLMLVYRRSLVPMYLILALIFAYALVDDAFILHEQLSLRLVGDLALPDPWQHYAYAQVLYFTIVASVSMALVLVGWIFANQTHRRLSSTMIALLAALAFLVAVLDFVHSSIRAQSKVVYNALDLVEDGGEMLIVTLACGIALGIYEYVKRERVLGDPPSIAPETRFERIA